MTKVNFLVNISLMKKETTIAVLFGIVLGGLLAVVIISKNKERQLEKTKAIAPVANISPISSQNNANYQALEITSPGSGAIVNKNSINIKGKADKDSLVIIQSPIKDMALQVKDKDFSVDFPLAFGENVIKINVYPKGAQTRAQEKSLRIYYLDEQL